MDAAILSEPKARRFFLGGLVIGAILLAFQAGRIWLADHWIESGEFAGLKKGVALVGGNAEGWDRLGHYYQFNFLDPDIAAAVTSFEKATDLDPLSSYYWIDLAQAYDTDSQITAADRSYQRAREIDPKSAIVAFNYGYFLIRAGRNEEGYEELRRAVRADSQQLPPVLTQVWHASHDANQLLDHVIPADADAYFVTLDFFASSRNAAPGMAVWQRLVALKTPFKLERAFPFLDELIHENDATDARRVWADAVSASGQAGGNSLISDGTFQTDFPGGGLGWRWEPELGMAIGFDSAPPSGKGRTVRIDFNGGVNSELKQPSQYVAVEPGQAYHFHAAIKTQDITTESGMRFRVSDPLHPDAADIQTANLTGSRPWTNVEQDVAAGPDTHFLRIELFRSPSQRFDNKLGGTVWIGDVSLVAAKPDASRQAQ